MALKIPEIKKLNELIQPILRESKIIGHSSKLLNAPGENYGSLMLSIDIFVQENGKDKTINMVAKLCPQNEWIARMFATDITFKKEVKFYLEMLPTLKQFHLEQKVPIINIFPKCLGARLNLNNTEAVNGDALLILENLKIKGYNSGDRLVGFNFQETDIVLKTLAYFHAVPLALKLKHPKKFEELMPLLNKINIGQEMFDDVGHKFIMNLAAHLNFNEEQHKKFEIGMHRGFEFQKYFPSGNEKYATTVHRDFWVNNTMILKQNGIPVDNILLDFQVITYGAPASDLIFFLFTSVIKDVLEKHYNTFIKIYHDYFVNFLKEFKCDVSDYTLEAFKKEIEIYGPLEVSHILIMFKAVFADRAAVKELNDFDLDQMFNDDDLTDTYFTRLRWTVDLFFKKNWL